MPKPIPVELPSKRFKSQQEASDYFREMRRRYKSGDTVNAADSKLLGELILRHPDQTKLAEGVDHFEVLDTGLGEPCFHIVSKAGSKIDFSPRHCIRGKSPPLFTRFSAACRTAVSPYLAERKSALLFELELSGDAPLESNGRWVLRHTHPSFRTIVEKFLEEESLVVDDSMFADDALQYGLRLEDEGLARRFREYHKKHANLELHNEM